MGWDSDAHGANRKSTSTTPNLVRVSAEILEQDSFSDRASVIKQELLGPPLPGEPSDHVYQFSQPPWTVAELFWPNVSGRLYPEYRRWTDVFPGAERIWVPSIYVGFLTLWFALGGVRLWGRKRKNVWLTRVCLFFSIASLGWYGAVWFWNEIAPASLEPKLLGPQVGGLYWAMAMVLPKYFAFRYPAKLFLIASLCLSLLAGVQLRRARIKFLTKPVAIYVTLSVAILSILAVGVFDEAVSQLGPDVLFGPLDAIGCRNDLAIAVCHGLVIVAIACAIEQLLAKQQISRWTAVWMLVVLTMVDVVIANRWLTSEVDATAFVGAVPPSRQLAEETADRGNKGPLVIYRARDWGADSDWLHSSSPDRLVEIVRWQRRTLFPKHHFADQVRVIGSFSSIWPQAYEDLLNRLDRYDDRDVPMKSLDELVPLVFLRAQGEQLTGAWLENVLSNGVPEIKGAEIELVRFRNSTVDVRVKTEMPCQVCFSCLDDGHWVLSCREMTTGETINQPPAGTGQWLLCSSVEPGEYEISLHYRPISFWAGAVISGISWAGIGVGFFIALARSRPKWNNRKL